MSENAIGGTIKVVVKTVFRKDSETDASFGAIEILEYSDYRAVDEPDAPQEGNLRVFADSADNVLKVKKPDGTVVPLEGGGSGGGVGQHRLLDPSAHIDTEATTLQRGMIIVARIVNSILRWVGLQLGEQGTVLKSNGLDAIWARVQWNEIENVPSTFPPSDHSHPLGDITQSGASENQVPKWSGSAWVAGNVTWNEVQNKPSTFPPSPHTHTRSDITDFAHNHPLTDLQQSGAQVNQVVKWDGSKWAAGNVAWDEVTNKPSTFPPSPHTHDAQDISSGRLSTSRLPTSDSANRFLVVRSAGQDPIYDTINATDLPTHTHSRSDLPAAVAYEDENNTFTAINDFTQTIRVPRKSDPSSPQTGEIWVNGKTLKYRDNQSTPATQVVEIQSNKGVANGYAPLDSSAQLPLANMPTHDNTKHTTASAVGLADQNSEGTSNAVARADHTHKRDVKVKFNNTVVGIRNAINFTGDGVSVSDDPENDTVNVTITGGGGSAEDVRVAVFRDGIQIGSIGRKLDFRTSGDVDFQISEDAANDQFDVTANVKPNTIADQHIATNANIAKSKIASAGTWSKSELPSDVVYTADPQELSAKTLDRPLIKDVGTTPVSNVLLKAIGGILHIRNQDDSADAKITGTAAERFVDGLGAHQHALSDISGDNAQTNDVPKWNGDEWVPGRVSYNELTDVPDSFPPSPHTHSRSDIVDFEHTHSRSDITDFAHAATHKHGGNDEIATATPAPNEIPKAKTNGKLDTNWLEDNQRFSAIGITIGDGVNVIQPGMKGTVWLHFSGTIVEWAILSTDNATPTIGSIEFDILKGTFDDYPNLSSIVGSGTKPRIQNSNKGNGIPTDWVATHVDAGDCIRFDVTEVQNLKRVTLVLKVKRD